MEEINNIKNLANECLSCPIKPCQTGCPLGNDIPEFIKLLKQDKYKDAYDLLCKTTVLQSICGRICPHIQQCQGKCVKGKIKTPVQIGQLEAFVGDMAIKNEWEIPKNTEIKINKKIAIIGGGPAGLTCSAFLAKEGYDVTIYEKHNSLGGILEHGIPDFRLNKEILNSTINKILDLGIKVKLKSELGKNIKLDNLEKEYDAIFLSFGANISSKMNIPGEEIEGVYGGNELLENKTFPDFKNKKVAIIGGGNVAMDVSRTINKLGAKQTIVIYRRSEKQMPADEKEILDAKKDGVEFLFQTNILKILGDKKVNQIECIKTELIKKEGEDREIPINIENSNFILDIDYVIMAVGSNVENELVKSLNLEYTNRGKIKIDCNKMTSREKIFAGGDLTDNMGTVAWAARAGRDAAENIIKYLKQKGE